MGKLYEGAIIRPNMNHIEFTFSRNERLKIVELGIDHVYAENLTTGEYVGDIGTLREIEFYYDLEEAVN